MSQNIVIVLFAVAAVGYGRCQTLMDIIQTESDLGEFREYAQKFLAAQLSEPSYTYTVFAPTDDAFLYYIRENAGNTNQLDSLPLWSYHLLNKKYTREDLLNNGNHSLPTLAPNSAPVWVIITDAIQSVQRDRPTVPPVPGQEPEPGKVSSSVSV
ncbi:PREDICTED: uncharacterized protein LOC106810493 [Priapulus caudatus]|uniref:Uncharacterized protein LOC106810493 n=1 Tax=Priapulus caudatus TaxID=37621 RepID=A0ABM1EAY9_PRICU|nr:PREDICTED: uncharacterized protein LOC106810493 [Priapulus caudatus]